MPKVFSIHEIELRHGVNAEQFEEFLAQQYIAGEAKPQGLSVVYLKGNQGYRKDKYLILFVFDSVEVHDRYYSDSDGISAELQQFLDQRTDTQKDLDKRFNELATPAGEFYTDYVVIDRATPTEHTISA